MTGTTLSRAERKAAQRTRLRASLPDLSTLTARLGAVFGGEAEGGEIEILNRQPNEYASSFPSEVVPCRLVDGCEVRVLLKLQGGLSHRAHGHRGDVAYEAEVYRHVLRPLACSA